MKRTNRGFNIYSEIKDSYGQEVRVQQSSNAEIEACWIFCHKEGKDAHIHLGNPQAYSPHLTKAQAKKVAKALLKFASPKPIRRNRWEQFV